MEILPFPSCPQATGHSCSDIPRVRTPCGHGAQVIVEGRESQSDGGENNKDHNNNPKTTTKGPQAETPPTCSLSSVLGETFFFHEYGRRVGMVPRSSLKEGKNRQMVEKGTKAPKPTQTKHPSPQAETPPSCSLPSTLGETCETETSGD